jgi:hypothetical protein
MSICSFMGSFSYWNVIKSEFLINLWKFYEKKQNNRIRRINLPFRESQNKRAWISPGKRLSVCHSLTPRYFYFFLNNSFKSKIRIALEILDSIQTLTLNPVLNVWVSTSIKLSESKKNILHAGAN